MSHVEFQDSLSMYLMSFAEAFARSRCRNYAPAEPQTTQDQKEIDQILSGILSSPPKPEVITIHGDEGIDGDGETIIPDTIWPLRTLDDQVVGEPSKDDGEVPGCSRDLMMTEPLDMNMASYTKPSVPSRFQINGINMFGDAEAAFQRLLNLGNYGGITNMMTIFAEEIAAAAALPPEEANENVDDEKSEDEEVTATDDQARIGDAGEIQEEDDDDFVYDEDEWCLKPENVIREIRRRHHECSLNHMPSPENVRRKDPLFADWVVSYFKKDCRTWLWKCGNLREERLLDELDLEVEPRQRHEKENPRKGHSRGGRRRQAHLTDRGSIGKAAKPKKGKVKYVKKILTQR